LPAHLFFVFLTFECRSDFLRQAKWETTRLLLKKHPRSSAIVSAHANRRRFLGRRAMMNKIRIPLAAVLVLSFSGAMSFAQSAGEATYKAKCQMCHGAKGLADAPAGKAMKVKPITDLEVKSVSEAKMIDAVRNGMGKMQPYKDKLTDNQIKEAVTYFRTFLN
jgi:cytochrome c6